MKNWWTSKTMWLAIAAGLVGVAELVADALGVGVPGLVYQVEIIVVAILGIIFRKATKTSITNRILPGGGD